ncbi:ABC-type transport auxiliary lipoprotein family protein [Novosphingobium fuchskuhlense]|uniref:ABC-type transport auxiliary lipoprotein family protein n=1 Tax=Novosphingobium fuchskuhlense TaxID=1117702 RepID=UPI000B0CDCB7|nr:ABC-type transport auxiliary lipoprotein family protein [Novosphingobium fuchskuhlense]
MNARTTRTPIVLGALSLVLLTALSGCVRIGNTKPPATFLTLTSDAAPSAGATSSGTLREATVVLEPSAAASVSVLRVPVQIDAANVAYIKGAQWVERPSRAFQHLLADTLRARGKGLVIETERGTVGTRIGGQLLAMGFDVRTRSAVVRFDAMKWRPDGRIETRRFESTVSGVDPEPDAIGPALNQAANKVAGEVADWVG